MYTARVIARMIKLSAETFIFEYDSSEKAKEMDGLFEFDYKGTKYKVKSIHQSFGEEVYTVYVSYFVTVELKD